MPRERKRERERDRETDRQTDRQTETEIDRQTDRHRETERDTDRQTDRIILDFRFGVVFLLVLRSRSCSCSIIRQYILMPLYSSPHDSV